MFKVASLGVLSWLALLVQLFSFVHAELDPIVIKGSHFFTKTDGKAFIIRGLTYYSPTFGSFSSTQPVDALADGPTCERDLPFFQDLNINVLRIYYINPTLDHSACMKLLSDAGIYVVADVTGAAYDIDAYNPRWHEGLLNSYTQVVDSLASFTNLLALSVGGFMSDEDQLTFVKAATRDVKQHIREKGLREIPIGWVSITWGRTTDTIAEYKEALEFVTCTEERADFFGLLMVSGRDTEPCPRAEDVDHFARSFQDSTIPVFSSDTGCWVEAQEKDNRTYGYMSEFFKNNATESLSGAIVMTFLPNLTQNQSYGLVNVGGANGDEIMPMNGFSALSSAMATVKPSFSNAVDYTPTATTPPCPTNPSNAGHPTMQPKPYSLLCSCMVDSLRCVAKKDVFNTNNVAELFDNISNACDHNMTSNCPGLTVDTYKGVFGAFSGCNNSVAYSWAANEYWQHHGDNACDLNGTAELRDERPPPSNDCKFLLDQVGKNGQNTLTAFLDSTPTGTSGTSGTATGSSQSVSGNAKKLSKGMKAGIALGVLLCVITVLLTAPLALRRKKKSKKGKEAISQSDPSDLPEFVPPPTHAQQQQNRLSELPEFQGLMRHSHHG
ncbi:carbohydrate-binding module family 43 protein [Lentithecium fluviatile CBS 122367]|uniref:1,3-beta-glucanosyltransferase n=1 Tax=Lentithecium fluviatile CBS 122367 TaxID=1168545 RepID=A0A6G1IGF8_9PLEO|nr:carbohydrate-binding module family 43 protein [Lentithecium fluviatile CBS 122367]